MAMRESLFRMIREICDRDGLGAEDIARMCGTSRPRAYALFARRIELFNSESLVDMLWRLGVDIGVVVTGRAPYLRYRFANPRPGWKPPPRARY